MLSLFIIVVIDLIGFGIVIPLLPFYAEHFNADPATVGLVMATYSFTQFLAAPFWGRTSDRTGRRPVLLVTLFGGALAYLMLAFADSLWMLFAARALGGAMAGNISTAFAYVADITTRENRAKGMGMIGAAFGLGFIIGPALGGLLAGPDPINADYRSPALAGAGLSLAALILALVRLKESLSPEIRRRIAARPRRGRLKQFSDALVDRNVGLLIALSFFATFAFAGLEATFAMWSRRQFSWGPEQNGYLFAFVGVVSALIQGGLIGRLAKRFGETRLIIQGAGALCLGIGLIPFSSTVPMLIIAMLIAAYGFSVISPALNSAISLRVGEGEQGSMMGVTRSATTLARVAGPAVAGGLFALLGRDWPYYAAAAVMLVVMLAAARARGRLTAAETPKNLE